MNKQSFPLPQAHNNLSAPSTPNLHRHSYTPRPIGNEVKPDLPRKTFPSISQPGRTETDLSPRSKSPSLPVSTQNLRRSPSPSITYLPSRPATTITPTLARPRTKTKTHRYMDQRLPPSIGHPHFLTGRHQRVSPPVSVVSKVAALCRTWSRPARSLNPRPSPVPYYPRGSAQNLRRRLLCWIAGRVLVRLSAPPRFHLRRYRCARPRHSTLSHPRPFSWCFQPSLAPKTDIDTET
jgi:hypothetical protein